MPLETGGPWVGVIVSSYFGMLNDTITIDLERVTYGIIGAPGGNYEKQSAQNTMVGRPPKDLYAPADFSATLFHSALAAVNLEG